MAQAGGGGGTGGALLLWPLSPAGRTKTTGKSLAPSPWHSPCRCLYGWMRCPNGPSSLSLSSEERCFLVRHPYCPLLPSLQHVHVFHTREPRTQHSPAGVASAVLSRGEGSPPSTCRTLPCAAQDTIHPSAVRAES